METTNDKPGHPTATVLVNGLAIFNHNQKQDCVDFGFLKKISETHPFRMKIFNVGGVYWSSEDYPERYFEKSITTIGVTTSKELMCYRHPNGRDFDERDYDWILNLNYDLYDGGEVEFKVPTADTLFAKLSIKDAIFYNKVKSASEAAVLDTETGDVKTSRKLGRAVAADLYCEENDNIEINIKWLENSRDPINITLSKSQGPYWISFEYICDPSEEDDFPYIYDVIMPPANGKFYTLRYRLKEEKWMFRGIIGNRVSKECIEECKLVGNESKFPHDLRVYFNSSSEAQISGYTPLEGPPIISGEYACQSPDLGGNKGIPFPLPVEDS